ncbi:MAG: FAD-dependent oxidoreductase [Gammaproteobacteria bacterium]|nr:FAD-dependent oxidoreductase [Gammaproteobacteria bacterium]
MNDFKLHNFKKPIGVKGDWAPSFWLNDVAIEPQFLNLQKPSQNRYDLIIVGGGLTGLTAALFVKARRPEASVLVIERGLLAAGATINSAGFATIGSISEILMHEAREGTEAIVTLTHRKLQGLRLLERLCGGASIDFDISGDFDVFGDHENDLFESSADHLDRLNTALYEQTSEKTVFSMADESMARCSINAKHVIKNRLNGSFHPGKLSQVLLQKVLDNHIDLATGVNITAVESGQVAGENLAGNEVEFYGTQVLLATNAYASELSPELTDIKPGRGQVLVTTPIKNLKLDRPCHIRRGFDYARPVTDHNGMQRVLIGGGRDLEIDTETTLERGTTEPILAHIKDTLQNVLLPNLIIGEDYDIDQTWSGTMGFGPQSAPRIKQIKPGLYCAVGLSSMGLAIGSLVGSEAADMLLS